MTPPPKGKKVPKITKLGQLAGHRIGVIGRSQANVALLNVILKQYSVDPAKVDLRVNYQALSTMAVRGSAASDWREMEKPFAKVVSDLIGRGFKGPLVLACGRPVHDAGGSEGQELAFALALALAYLRTLEAGGIALDSARAISSSPSSPERTTVGRAPISGGWAMLASWVSNHANLPRRIGFSSAWKAQRPAAPGAIGSMSAAPRGPCRQKATSASTSSRSPSKTASTVPSGRFRTQPATPREVAARSTA